MVSYKLFKLIYQQLINIFNQDYQKNATRTMLTNWSNNLEKSGFKAFNIVSKTIQNKDETILNYFKNISTNASAESFNAKIKAYRVHYRGVKNVKFFLYRLTKIYT